MKLTHAILSAAMLAAVPAVPALAAQEGVEFTLAGTGSSYLGVGTAEVTSSRAKELNLRDEHGVEITMIEENGPAARAGLKKGDVVLEYNGQRVEGTEQFIRLVRETPSGREVKLLISRNGSPQTLAVTTGTRKLQVLRGDGMNFVMPATPVMPEMPNVSVFQSGWRMGALGIEGESLTPQLAQFFGVKDGVLVRSVRQDSPAEKAGIKAGDVITRVDGKDVNTPSAITSVFRSARDRRTFSISLTREKRESSLNVTLDEEKMPNWTPVAPVAHWNRM